jgi:PAS domain S-box-containing protein
MDARLKTYQELFKISNDGFVLTDTKGNIIDCNPAFEKITGYSPGELRETSIYHITPKESWEKEKEMVIRQVLEKKSKVSFNKVYINKAGHKVHARVCIYPHSTDNKEVHGVWAVVTDITEEIKAEKEIKENREKLQIILDNVPLGIYRSDHNGNIISANEALIRMFGFKSPEELQEYPSLHFYVNKEKRKELLEKIKEKKTIKGFKIELKRKDNSKFWGSVNVKGIFDENGKLLFFDGIIDDITERLRTREVLEKSKNEAKNALKETRFHNKKLKALLEGAHSILKYNNFEKTAKLLFDQCKKVTGATAGYTALLTEDGTGFL